MHLLGLDHNHRHLIHSAYISFRLEDLANKGGINNVSGFAAVADFTINKGDHVIGIAAGMVKIVQHDDHWPTVIMGQTSQQLHERTSVPG